MLTLLRRDWQRHLRNLNRAANTQRIYDTVASQFCEWLAEHNRPLARARSASETLRTSWVT